MLYELKNIVRTFKGKNVLDISSLEIERGKIYTLIGPNGAGKTTLLNLLAFLDEPSAGELYFDAQRVVYGARQILPLRRRVVLVDQYPILFTGPVWKNVEYGLKVRGVKAAERNEKVLEMLDLVGMSRFIDADAHKLSGGETKRVALARALAIEPEVLLCDEPGANVDKENQQIILSIIKKINSISATSVIFSTHYLSQGRLLADKTLMLEHGSLSDVLNENFVRAEVVERKGDLAKCRVADKVELAVPATQLGGEITEFKLRIDPEKVVLLLENDHKDRVNTIPGTVVRINQDKERIRMGVDVGFKLQFFISMQEYLQAPPIIGQKVFVELPLSAIRCNVA